MKISVKAQTFMKNFLKGAFFGGLAAAACWALFFFIAKQFGLVAKDYVIGVAFFSGFVVSKFISYLQKKGIFQ